jgi:hypothetical protein
MKLQISFHRLLGVCLLILGLVAAKFYLQTGQRLLRLHLMLGADAVVPDTARWQAQQEAILLKGWQHLDGGAVGQAGGTQWMARLMTYVEAGEPLGCATGHKEAALSYISCQTPPPDADAAEFWKQWWRENKDKSQIQWVQEGMAKQGLSLQNPTTPACVAAVFSRLGVHAASQEAARIPGYLSYNAYRWLRDCGGVDPAAVDAAQMAIDPEHFQLGQQNYKNWLAQAAQTGRLGWDEQVFDETALSFKPPNYQKANAVIWGGILLLCAGGLATFRTANAPSHK